MVEPSRAATLFCRVSSKQQAANYSREAQQRLGEEYAARHGLTITRVFQVVETASKKAARQKWNEYLQYVRRGPEHHALIASVDRALRNYADLPEIADLRKKHGKTVHFFLEGLTLDGTHASTTDLRLGISAAVAVWYAGELAEKVRRGTHQKALKGEWPNVAPYGYKNEKRRLVVDPDRVRWVRRIKELSAEARHPLDSIVKQLALEGCLLYGRPMQRTMVERIIRNPLYAGRFEWPKGSGQWIQGIHEPIVSWDLHEAAIAGLERRNLPLFRKHLFTFAGMIRCGCCPEGRAVVFVLRKNKYVYAYCTGYRRKHADGRQMCPDAEFVPLDTIDKQAQEVLAGVQISYDLAAAIYDAIAKRAGQKQSESQTNAALLRGQLTKLEQRMAQAYADKLDGKIEEEFWKGQQRQWAEEKIRIEEAIRRQEEASPDAYMQKVRDLLKLTKDIIFLYKNADVGEKRRILNIVCGNWKLRGKKLDYIMKKPFAQIAEGLLLQKWWVVQDAIEHWAIDPSLTLGQASEAAPTIFGR